MKIECGFEEIVAKVDNSGCSNGNFDGEEEGKDRMSRVPSPNPEKKVGSEAMKAEPQMSSHMVSL